MNRASKKNSGPVPVNRPVYRNKNRQSSAPSWALVAGAALLVVCISLGILFSRNNVEITEITPTTETNIEPTTSPLPSPVPSATQVVIMPDIPSLQLIVLDLINQDRRAGGLLPLEWDQTAATTGIIQAQEMAQFGYLSYWNLDGLGPDLRFYANGGIDNIKEWSYRKQITAEILPSNSKGWEAIVRNMYAEYARNPSFRESAFHPAYTHAGIGVAYDSSAGWLVLTQEFLGKYLSINPLPRTASIGTEIELVGKSDDPDVKSVSVELKYEPNPIPRTLTELNSGGDFISAAETFQSFDLPVDQGQFNQKVLLDNLGQLGYYHICIWINTPKTGRFLAVDYIIQVVQ